MVYKYRGRYKEQNKVRYRRDREAYKWRYFKNYHKLTKEDYYNFLEKQDNKCALCRRPFEGLSSRIIHVDHCHETHKIRGLLCMPCNVALGMLGDTVEGLEKAVNYLKGN